MMLGSAQWMYLGPINRFGLGIEYVHLPRRKMRIISQLADELRMADVVPSRVAALVRDLVAYKNRVHLTKVEPKGNGQRKQAGFRNVFSIIRV